MVALDEVGDVVLVGGLRRGGGEVQRRGQIITLIGGAVITEKVFGFSGMGNLFNDSLGQLDIYPIMGFFLITGITAMVFNLVADLLYSVLDPRVRVKA